MRSAKLTFLVLMLIILIQNILLGQSYISLKVDTNTTTLKTSSSIAADKELEKDNRQVFFFHIPHRDFIILPIDLLPSDIKLDSTVFRLEVNPTAPHYLHVDYPSDRETQIIILNSLTQAFQVNVELLLSNLDGSEKCLLENRITVQVEPLSGQAAQKNGNYILKLEGKVLRYKSSVLPFKGSYELHFIPQYGRACIQITDTITSTRQRYRFYEAFKIEDTWYRFEEVDLLKQQVKLHKLTATERPYGYQEGNYVDLELLKKNTKKSWNKDQKPYALLHFWGPWCIHCIKEIDRLNDWQAKMAKENSPVQFLDYSLMLAGSEAQEEYLESKLKTLQAAGKADKKPTVVYPPSFQATDDPARQAPNAIFQLDILKYPSYILIDQKGKIICRHEGVLDEAFEAILEKYLAE